MTDMINISLSGFNTCSSVEEIVDKIEIELANLEKDLDQHNCSKIGISLEEKKKCSRRLNILSFLQAELSYCSGCSDDDYDAAKKKCQSSHEAAPIHENDSYINFKTANDSMHGERSDYVNENNSRISSILIKRNQMVESLLYLFTSKCVFTSHLSKKVIVAFAVWSPDKMNEFLQHVELLLLQDLKRNLALFELLNYLIKHKHCSTNSNLVDLVFRWFQKLYINNLRFSLPHAVIGCIDERSRLLNVTSCLSFIKKIANYKDDFYRMKTSLVSILIDVFVKHAEVKSSLTSSEDSTGVYFQHMILKVIKIFNTMLDLGCIIKQDNASTIDSNIVTIAKALSPLYTNLINVFSMMLKNDLCVTTFWGRESLSSRVTGSNQCISSSDCGMARQLMVLGVKLCLFSSFSQHYSASGIWDSTHHLLELFRSWMVENLSLELDDDDGEWLSVFLSEDDDQWITVLFSLLLIASNLKNKGERKEMDFFVTDDLEIDSKGISQSKNISITSTAANYLQRQEGIVPEPRSLVGTNSPNTVHSKYSSQPSSTREEISDANEITSPSDIINNINHRYCSHKLFFQFVKSIDFDHLVLADLIMSPETEFLAYITKYFSLLDEEWDAFYYHYYNSKQKFDKSHCHRESSALSDVAENMCSKDVAVNIDKKVGEKRLNSSTISDNFSLHSDQVSIKAKPLEFEIIDDDHKNNEKIRLIDSTYDNLKHSNAAPHEDSYSYPLVSYSDSNDSKSLSSHDNNSSDGEYYSHNKRKSEDNLKSETETTRSHQLCADDIESNLVSCGTLYSPSDTDGSFSLERNSILSYKKTQMVLELNKIIGGCGSSSTDPLERDCKRKNLIYAAESNKIIDRNKKQRLHSDDSSVSLVSSGDDNGTDSNEPYLNLLKDDDDICDSSDNHDNDFEKLMTMLIRLQLHIERLNDRNLISYDATYLLKMLNSCVEKYESPKVS